MGILRSSQQASGSDIMLLWWNGLRNPLKISRRVGKGGEHVCGRE
jgi:hypothetical protein